MAQGGGVKRSKPLTRKVPLRPGTKRMKSRRRACGTPTIAQQAHQDAQRAHGCAMCLLLGMKRAECGPVRVHHRTTGDLHGNLQLGQDDTLGLGDWHHQGVLMPEYPTVDAMRDRFGPSLQHHKKAFLDVIADNLGERSTAALQRWQDAQLAPVTWP